ncbi:MAG TPA: CBS domain-containing protein [Bacteroidetes bacterium]|nr:CBS domain-containing protein [Bacteroidota bacterium]
MKTIRSILEDPDAVKNVVVAYDLMEPNARAVTPETSLDDVMKLFGQLPVGEVPVVDSKDRTKLLGYITRRDVIHAYNKEIAKREMTLGLQRAYSSLAVSDLTELVDGYYLVELAAPRRFVGKSLLQLNLRNKYNVQVVLVRRANPGGEELKFVPDANYTINEKDVLILMGKRKDLERIRKL